MSVHPSSDSLGEILHRVDVYIFPGEINIYQKHVIGDPLAKLR